MVPSEDLVPHVYICRYQKGLIQPTGPQGAALEYTQLPAVSMLGRICSV